jgi:hypothetical protein
MKYVMLQTQIGDMKQAVPIIFPKQLNHIDVADAIRKLEGMENAQVVSAGECNVRGQCGGRSPTLSLDSRGKEDDEIINTIDYMQGLIED